MVVGMIASSPAFALGHAREASSLLQFVGNPTNHSREHTVHLANQFLQMSHGQNWTKDEKTAMLPLLSSLETSYNGQVDIEHAADQNTWNAEAAKFTACYAGSSAKFVDGGSVYQEDKLLEEFKSKFKACSAVDKCFDDYKAKSVCTSQGFSFGIGTAHDVELKNVLVHMESEVQLYHSAAPETTSLPPNGCGEDQMRMEAQMCEMRKVHRWACESESDCVSSIDLLAIKSSLKGQQDARRDAKLSFKKTMCAVKHVLGMTVEGEWQGPVTSESSCDNLSLDSSDLILDLTAPEAKIQTHCEDPYIAIYPSTSDSEQCSEWLEAEFGGWISSSVTIPDTCKATCMDAPVQPTPTPAPTPAPTPTRRRPRPPAAAKIGGDMCLDGGWGYNSDKKHGMMKSHTYTLNGVTKTHDDNLHLGDPADDCNNIAESANPCRWDPAECVAHVSLEPEYSAEWIGMSGANGHCWVVPKGSTCPETDWHAWFQGVYQYPAPPTQHP